jgi:hypothetical protein
MTHWLAATSESAAVDGMRLVGIVVGGVLLLAAIRAMFGKRRR